MQEINQQATQLLAEKQGFYRKQEQMQDNDLLQAGCLLNLIFHPEDGDIFFRNVR
jgi:hypothetical protein